MAEYNTKGFITKLQEKEVIVVGTNCFGLHAGGAAAQAHRDFGLQWGIGVGISGQTYGIPTMEIDLENIALYIKQFIDYATITPDKTYYVTKVGCGIAGHSEEEMGEIWSRYTLPTNIKLL